MSELDGLKLLRRIEEGVAGKFGEAFFKQIVCELSGALDAHAAFASRLNPDRSASMLAFWVQDHFDPCLSYSLAGTPCEYVYRGEITSFARNIGDIFPVDREWFAQLGVNSYLGIPIMNETGAVFGHLAVMDRRERDWREADVDVLRLFSLRTAVELERSISHLRLEEANIALSAATRVAEMANHAKSVFISQMSHELRTPLNGILGYTQLMRRSGETLSSNQLEGLKIIERSGEHLLTLVDDLLDLAKIEAGKLELVEENLDLREVLTHVADLIRERANRAQLEFLVQEQGVTPRTVRGDSRAVRQILLNLLGNAIKFTRSGGRVTLRVASAADAHRVHFAIEDDGIGIPEQELPNIFEPFHRVADGRALAEGTGLGLTITQRLISAMGSQLRVRSQVGVGSVFEFEVDFRAGIEVQTARSAVAAISSYRGRLRAGLIVDDDAVSRDLLSGLLRDLGFDVHVAPDAQTALEVLARRRPDIIITDVLMPGMNGAEFLQAIRADTALAKIPVMALSASASRASHGAIPLDGFDALLTKPLRFEELFARMAELLQLEWVRGSEERDFIAELSDLAMRGDVQALMQRCADEVRQSEETALLYQELQAHALAFDTEAIRGVLAARR